MESLIASQPQIAKLPSLLGVEGRLVSRGACEIINLATATRWKPACQFYWQTKLK
ncbi:MAG: hypothetical protein A4E49_02252 [Methanosaeta sp. PtaU1.Bin112]|nr:MAG: hypothetical protein A4E49_02252 [Methanosaeta sp. PtaU1.Bin112]